MPKVSQDKVTESLEYLQSEDGVPLIPYERLTIGEKIGSGGFGTVMFGTFDGNDVAVKTIILSAANGETELTDFCDEARAAWMAGKPGREENDDDEDAFESTICGTLGVSHDFVEKGAARVHLIMEKLNVEGDLHDVMHLEENWEYKPDRIKPKTYACIDGDGDYMLYVMPRQMKISLATQIARALRECRTAGVLHNDIKPDNVMLLEKRGDPTDVAQKKKKKKTSKTKKRKRVDTEPARCRVKLIDFGLGGPPERCQGYSCGTPGYQAPEVSDYGECSYKSDVFSAGVCILEIWMGQLWTPHEKDDEAEMKRARLDCLRRLDRNDPTVAALLRRCLNVDKTKRPTAKQLQQELIKIRKAG